MSDKRGFILLAIDTDQDKMRYAYTAAMSIKQCDPEASICVVVDKGQQLSSLYAHAFDYITELPFGNTAFKDGFHGMNIWQLIHATPYEETIYVDYDTLFINVDIDLLWANLYEKEIAIPHVARTFRNSKLDQRNLFEFEDTYKFPKLYNNFIYFKRDSKLAIEWFKMADPVFQHWRDVYKSLMKDKKPSTFNKNILGNIVTHLLDAEVDVSIAINELYDLQIHSQKLWNGDLPDSWTDVLNHWFTDNKKLIIENSMITSGIVHYRNEEFITEEIIDEYRAQISIDNRRKAAS